MHGRWTGAEHGCRKGARRSGGIRCVFPLCDVLAARKIPFVLTSGYADWNMPQKWHDRPRLQKPYTMEQVERALIECLD